QPTHLKFLRSRAVYDGKPAHGTGRRSVRKHTGAVDGNVRDVVRAGDKYGVLLHRVWPHPCIGPRVMKALDLTGHDTAILHNAVFEVEFEHAPFCRIQ